MKKISAHLLLLISVFSNAQTICGTADEGGTVTLTAPAGNFISSIDFASYGTPNGSCGSFTIGTCDAANSMSIAQATFVGQTSASLDANNGVFGDPCVGTFKRLYIQATYSTILPLRLISFTAKKTAPDKVVLNWTSADEMNTYQFNIEKSSNGVLFNTAGTVQANGMGAASYNFTDIISANTLNYYYRLKMIDRDGKFHFSNIIRVQNSNATVKFSLFPNPGHDYITIASELKQEAIITNVSGQLIRKINLVPGDQTVNIDALIPGVYFIKTNSAVIKFFKTVL